jgi:hypothetical protein
MMRRIAAALVVGAAAATLVASPAEAATPALHFSYALPNSPHADYGSNTSLNAEWIRIKNSASHSVNLSGYTVRDRVNHVYRFGSYTLHAGESVTIHTGRGTSTHANRYWGKRWYVWNNGGDEAWLKTSGGTTKDTCSWRRVGNGVRVGC